MPSMHYGDRSHAAIAWRTAERVPFMKKIAIFVAVFAFILVLTKIANQVPPTPLPGTDFWMNAVHVVACSPNEITLVDTHQTESHFDKDDSWPACSTFTSGQVLDFHLSRGAKTHFLSDQPSAWWR